LHGLDVLAQLALGGVRSRARWLLAFVLAFFVSSAVSCSASPAAARRVLGLCSLEHSFGLRPLGRNLTPHIALSIGVWTRALHGPDVLAQLALSDVRLRVPQHGASLMPCMCAAVFGDRGTVMVVCGVVGGYWAARAAQRRTAWR
jgi:hypothetical protein